MYKLSPDRREKLSQHRRRGLAKLALVIFAAITVWALWTGAMQLWSMRSPARVNTTEDGCLKAGKESNGSQAEVCPDKKR